MCRGRYHRNGVDAILALQAQGKADLGAGTHPRRRSPGPGRGRMAHPARPQGELRPVVLVVGNEVTGIDPAIIELADRVVAIPMHGSKRSLNVAVAFGVAAYFLTGG